MNTNQDKKEFKYQSFSEINLHDQFFDSLKKDYQEFEQWFNKKADKFDRAYIHHNDDNMIDGFLYLKEEDESLSNITFTSKTTENLLTSKQRRLKVGTLKIDAHGTKLGERFIKKIFDYAMYHKFKYAYLTVFPKHSGLIDIITRYGFRDVGTKKSSNGLENVYFKSFQHNYPNILENYPRISIKNKNFWLLSIFPEFHTPLFPDSRLKTEASRILNDVSYTNSIHKVYLSANKQVNNISKEDIILIYRTKDEHCGEYSSLCTSICVVEEIRSLHEFSDQSEFINYCLPHSIFEEDKLKNIWMTKEYKYAIRFLYNLALPKRIIRQRLINEVGIDRDKRWALVPIEKEQFLKIVELGEVNACFIIN